MVGSLRRWTTEVEAESLFVSPCVLDWILQTRALDVVVVDRAVEILGRGGVSSGGARRASAGPAQLEPPRTTESPGRGPVPGELGSPGRPGSCYGTPAGASPQRRACAVRAGVGRDFAPTTPGWNPVLGELGSPRRPGSCYGAPAGASPWEPVRLIGAVRRYTDALAGVHRQQGLPHALAGDHRQQALPSLRKRDWDKFESRSGDAAQHTTVQLAAPPGRAEREE